MTWEFTNLSSAFSVQRRCTFGETHGSWTGSPLRGAVAATRSWFAGRGHRDAGAGHRGQHGDVQRAEHLPLPSASISPARAAGSGVPHVDPLGQLAALAANFIDFRERNDVFTEMVTFNGMTPVLIRDGQAAERLQGMLVSGNFFAALGVPCARPRVLGRRGPAESTP